MTSKNAQETELTPKQARALSAILTTPTLAAAADACGLSTRTMTNFMNMPHFRQALAQAEAQAMSEAARRLAIDASAAAQTLKDIMADPLAPAAARVNAARAWLALTPEFRRFANFEERLNELEKRLTDGNNRK